MSNGVKQAMCAIVCASMIASGCATAGTTVVTPANADSKPPQAAWRWLNMFRNCLPERSYGSIELKDIRCTARS